MHARQIDDATIVNCSKQKPTALTSLWIVCYAELCVATAMSAYVCPVRAFNMRRHIMD